MRKRNILGMIGLVIITIGIYSIYHLVSTKNEMNKLGAKIPTAWLLIVPFVNIWWLWEYSKGVEQVTHEKANGILVFVLLFVVSFIGQLIVQDYFNNLGETAPVDVATGSQAATQSPPELPGNTQPATVNKKDAEVL